VLTLAAIFFDNTSINNSKKAQAEAMTPINATLLALPYTNGPIHIGHLASSGIHQDGVIKNRDTYEIMNPHDVGVTESAIILTARSGRAALAYRAKNIGYELEKLQLDKVYHEFLKLADSQKEITDKDIPTIIKASNIGLI